MNDIVLRYNNHRYYIINNGQLIGSDDSVAEEYQNGTNTAIETTYKVNSYKDLLNKLQNDQKNRLAKSYINFITDDYFVVARKIMNDNRLRMLVSYKIENVEIKNLLYLLLNNQESAVCLATFRSKYYWIAAPDALDVLFTAAMLDSNGVVKFARHQKLKKNGKVRIYYAPDDDIKKPLQHLNRVLQSVYDKKNADFQVAYKKGKSVYDNAKIHKDKKYVFNIDLKDFYPSCKRELVRKYISFLFSGALNKHEMIEKFLDVILIDDGLFIGNPISGCLANAILNKPVAYLKNICNKAKMNFSVYADDMSFSSDKFISEEFVKSLFSEAFAAYEIDKYFTLNDDKSIGYSGCNRKITGISINDSNKITISRRYYRELRVMIDHLAKGDNTINIKRLQGKIAYATMIDDSGKVYRYLIKFEKVVHEYNLCSDEKMQELHERFKEKEEL